MQAGVGYGGVTTIAVWWSTTVFGSIVQTLNSIAAIEFQGWAVRTVTLSHAGRVAINCGSVHSFEVGNHTLLLGDIQSPKCQQ